MKTESLDKFHEASERLLDIELELMEYSRSLRIVGNDVLAERLEALALSARKSHNLVQQATGEAVSDHVKMAEEATTNMVLGALAVTEALAPEIEKGRSPPKVLR